MSIKNTLLGVVAIIALSSHAITITLPEDAIPAEQTAKDELSNTLKAMNIPEASIPVFHLGQSPETAEALKVSWDALAPDQILMKEVDGEIYLSGARPRGTLYAVYEYLEKCGVRYWTPDVTYIPQNPELPCKDLSVSYAPAFFMRGTNASGIVRNPVFASRMRNNGTGWSIPLEYGGIISIYGWCHTFQQLIPPGKYFATHPEWFSLHDGKRIHDGQLCLTNPELLQEMIKTADAVYKDRRGTILSISINDNRMGCECENCKKMDEQYGSPAGTLLWFVNQISEALTEKYPEILIDTLAYNHTTPPPHGIVPASNVLVRFCFMGANYAHPLESEQNAKFIDQLRAWSTIAPRLSVWNYVANFNNKLVAHPNIAWFGQDLRMMKNHHVCTIFEESTPNNHWHEDFAEMRSYLLSKLMWNPDLDQDELTKDFINGFYGEVASPYILSVLNEIKTEVENNPTAWAGIECATTTPWQSQESLLRCHKLWQQAIEATKNDSVHNARIRKTALSTRFAILTRYEATRWCADQGVFATLDLTALLKETIQWSQEFNFNVNDITNRLEKLVGPHEAIDLPEICKNLPISDYVIVPYQLFTIKCLTSWNWIVDDPASPLGKSVMFTGKVPEWILEAPSLLPDYRPQWTVYAELRCETESVDINAVNLVLYDWGNAKEYKGKTVTAKQIQGDKFVTIKIGTYSLTPTTNLIFHPFENSNIKTYVNRVFFVKEK